MPKVAGRKAEIRKAGVKIAGVMVLSFKHANTPMSSEDFDSLGFPTFLTGAGDWSERSLSFDVSGIYTDPVLRDIAFDPTANQAFTDLTLVFANALVGKRTLGGTFIMTSYEDGNPMKEATTFSASFVSSGAWTLT